MDIGYHHKLAASSNWAPHQPFNMAMEPHGSMFDHDQIINPFEHAHWPNYNPTFPNQLPQTPLVDTGFKLEVGDKEDEVEDLELGPMKEMMFKLAALQPVDIDPASLRKPKRRNVRISDDPQSVAARLRREKISEKIRILQRLVPGGGKLDTATMLDEAARYVKFLKKQVRVLQGTNPCEPSGMAPNVGPGSEDWFGAAGGANCSSGVNAGSPYGFYAGKNAGM